MPRLLLFILIFFASYSSILAQSVAAEPVSQLQKVKENQTFFFTDRYLLTIDSCADIVRNGVFNSKLQKFAGPFKDVQKQNPKQTVAKGSYNEKGEKEGEFILYFPNGQLQARGSFKEDAFIDMWDLYYANGKPKVAFEVIECRFHLINAWNGQGHQIVNNMKGSFEIVIGAISWKGNISDGLPDGKWTARRKAFRQEEVLATEIFKNGLLKKGSNATGVYKDSSRIRLEDGLLFPILAAEKLMFTSLACGPRTYSFMDAYYPGGAHSFINEIGQRFTPMLHKFSLTSFYEPMELLLIVGDNGKLQFDPANNTHLPLVSALGLALHGLPLFTPAQLNGNTAAQKMLITITYNTSVFKFSFKLLPPL